jgi:hypothetical protein
LSRGTYSETIEEKVPGSTRASAPLACPTRFQRTWLAPGETLIVAARPLSMCHEMSWRCLVLGRSRNHACEVGERNHRAMPADQYVELDRDLGRCSRPSSLQRPPPRTRIESVTSSSELFAQQRHLDGDRPGGQPRPLGPRGRRASQRADPLRRRREALLRRQELLQRALRQSRGVHALAWERGRSTSFSFTASLQLPARQPVDRQVDAVLNPKNGAGPGLR